MGERQHFSDELKAEAIRMVVRDGVEGIEGTPSVAELVKEVNRLRKELAQSKMETEILKISATHKCAMHTSPR